MMPRPFSEMQLSLVPGNLGSEAVSMDSLCKYHVNILWTLFKKARQFYKCEQLFNLIKRSRFIVKSSLNMFGEMNTRVGASTILKYCQNKKIFSQGLLKYTSATICPQLTGPRKVHCVPSP